MAESSTTDRVDLAERPATFSQGPEEVPNGTIVETKIVTRCWCGWSTLARNNTLYGRPDALTQAKTAHRFAHIEAKLWKEDG